MSRHDLCTESFCGGKNIGISSAFTVRPVRAARSYVLRYRLVSFLVGHEVDDKTLDLQPLKAPVLLDNGGVIAVCVRNYPRSDPDIRIL